MVGKRFYYHDGFMYREENLDLASFLYMEEVKNNAVGIIAELTTRQFGTENRQRVNLTKEALYQMRDFINSILEEK